MKFELMFEESYEGLNFHSTQFVIRLDKNIISRQIGHFARVYEYFVVCVHFSLVHW